MLLHRGEIDGQAFTLRGVSRRQMATISKHGKVSGANWGLAFRPNHSGEMWDLAVRTDLSDERVASTIAHELLHVGDWHKSEEWVDATSIAIGKALIAMGFRRSTDGKKT